MEEKNFEEKRNLSIFKKLMILDTSVIFHGSFYSENKELNAEGIFLAAENICFFLQKVKGKNIFILSFLFILLNHTTQIRRCLQAIENLNAKETLLVIMFECIKISIIASLPNQNLTQILIIMYQISSGLLELKEICCHLRSWAWVAMCGVLVGCYRFLFFFIFK